MQITKNNFIKTYPGKNQVKNQVSLSKPLPDEQKYISFQCVMIFKKFLQHVDVKVLIFCPKLRKQTIYGKTNNFVLWCPT